MNPMPDEEPRTDLHTHTFFSDGRYSPEDLVAEAVRGGLRCLAVTDHDTLAALPRARRAASGRLEIVGGVELSAQWEGRDIHILGYFVDETDRVLIERLQTFQGHRRRRLEEMTRRLRESGLPEVTWDEVAAEAGGSAIFGRAHLARVLVRRGLAADVAEAFRRYLAEGRPAYVAKARMEIREAVALIHRAGGVAVMAHPVVTAADACIPVLAAAGLDGLEVFYPRGGERAARYYAGLARRYGLLLTGGSDAHGGDREGSFVGRVRVPYRFVERLKTRRDRVRRTEAGGGI